MYKMLFQFSRRWRENFSIHFKIVIDPICDAKYNINKGNGG